MENSPVRNYESVYILKPDTSEEGQKSFFQKNKQIIESFKGNVHNVDTWGQRHLANDIDKYKRGLYFHMTFQSQANGIAELERTMRINDTVLRFYHKRLDSRVTLDKHLENFKDSLLQSKKRLEEKEAKAQARKAAAGAQKKSRKPAR